MIFSQKFIINIQHVDVAGVIFFPRLFEITQTTLEAFLNKKKINLSQLIFKKKIPFIIKSTSLYFHPLKLGDKITVNLNCSKIGNSSFELEYNFFNQKKLLAQAKTVQVFTNKGNKTTIPSKFKNVLKTIYK